MKVVQLRRKELVYQDQGTFCLKHRRRLGKGVSSESEADVIALRCSSVIVPHVRLAKIGAQSCETQWRRCLGNMSSLMMRVAETVP